MSESYEEEVIFMLTKNDILVCSNELEMPKEQVTDDVEVAKSTPMEAVKCPLGLVCYPSCFWWKNGKCTFPAEEEKQNE